MARAKKPVAEQTVKTVDIKKLKAFLTKRVKEFTRELKEEGEKCGIILDVTVVVREEDNDNKI